MKIYALRHEKRNKSPTFDTDLTQDGFNNANELCDVLESLNIDEIYCSPFKRIIQTIEPYLKKFNKKVNIEYSLYEYINSNEFSESDIRGINSGMYGYEYFNLDYESFLKHNEIVYPEGKERLNNRMFNFEKLLIDSSVNKNILIVSHMLPLNTLLKDRYENKYPQGGISLIFEDDKKVFNKVNFV